MKIVFTAINKSEDSLIDSRFGRAKVLVLFDEQTNTKEYISNDESEHMDQGAGLQTAQKVLKLSPDVIVLGSAIGYKTLDVIKQTDIKVYIGATDMTIDEAYKAFKNNKLKLQN
ncbi:dinitrogenase iron-molybdenum cofactor biosynthesis protein [Malaciobacter canalis]|uniref:Dinitrogenase iron-molybdenum cofactor biosynthesis protein n=1 Tax=Malaciobacter canalis TaxID=1912871 RepID=A0ABX4LTP1_9BACT|nr:NifB/NifX family molybdenum-iron cluster-binding protein [Malaciobacter canalis]PHO09561.1 dinitrogenase iron-molybdenum cofactor biosynthesis protein [Malaciobacter canalis]QEE31626.1 dinitrogenase iron-molybdenum cofactor biosynthesis protein [Malaciobacter canalis]